MTPEAYATIQQHFLGAREIRDEDQRAAFLQAIESLEIRHEVASLLEVDSQLGPGHSDAEKPSSTPAKEVEGLGETRDLEQLHDGSLAKTSDSLPARIGNFRILQKIGEGGCGTVYMAEQLGPIQRRVAVKVIKSGMDSREILARFHAERQALALMESSSIAKMFEVGTTAQGQPYFAMELVKGVPITDFCAARKLDVRSRLKLFVQVCHAVHHAHQKGVIHRDLKPSNILVTLSGGEPLAKVIDFGIAKALNAKLTEMTLFTQFGQLIGTLEYMSPEQADLSDADIDTRSDVYSLGVLLYQLLTGVPPLSRERLMRGGLWQLRQTLRDVEPMKPSTRIITWPSQTEGEMPSDKPPLATTIDSDLDWITMTALSKDRDRRFASASELAQDVERYLQGRAITARPPTIAYTLSRWLRRNRLAVAATCVLCLGLTVAVAGLAAGFLRALQSLRETQAARLLAERARERADRSAADMAERLYGEFMHEAWWASLTMEPKRAQELLQLCPEPSRGWEWQLTRSQALQSRSALRDAGASAILALDFSPDGRQLAVAAANGQIELWDLVLRKQIATLPSDVAVGNCLRYSSDGSRLYAADQDGGLQCFDLHRRELLFRMPWQLGGIYDLRVIDREPRLVACTGAGYCILFDPTTQSILKTIKLPVRCHRLVCDRGGTVAYLATLDGPSAVIRVNLEKGSLETITPSDDPATEAIPVDAEHWVYRCRNIVRWRSYDSPDEVTIGYQAGDVEDLVAIPETHRVLVATGAGTILAWDMSSESKAHVLQRYRISIRQLAYSPSARWVAVGLADGRIDVLPCEAVNDTFSDVSLRGEVRLLPADQGWLVRTGDNRIQHYSLANDLLAEFDVPELIALGADPTGEHFVAFGSDWKLRNGALRDAQAVIAADVMEGVRPVVYSPDGRWLAGPPPRPQAPEPSPSEGTIGLWSVDPLAPQKNLVGHTNWVTELCWFANSQELVSIANDSSIRLWDCMRVTCEGIFEHPMKSSPTAVAVAGDARWIIVGFDDGDVMVWNADSGREVMTLHAFGDGISTLCVTPDQQRLLVGCASKSAFQIYRTQDWTKVTTLDGGCGAIQHLQISATDGSLLVQGRSRHRLFKTDGTSPAHNRHSPAGATSPVGPRFRLSQDCRFRRTRSEPTPTQRLATNRTHGPPRLAP